ncbi:MAG: sulfotransferase family 2 domain-containing protein [Bacteroidota bacterium]
MKILKKHLINPTKINFTLDRKNIFIHIPKNAGSSISSNLGFKESSHATYKQIQNQINKKKLKKIFIFTFVRNPIDRFFSLYNYARLKESKYHSSINPKKAKYGKHLDFDLLKDASIDECAKFLIEGKLRHDTFWNHWCPQTDWICDESGKIAVDYFGRVEYLEADFKFLCSKLDFKYSNLPTLNGSNLDKMSKAKSFSLETKQIIKHYYKKDFDLLGYNL